MFDVPVDAWYAWVGLVIVGAALLGVASSLPTEPPPDAASLAATVDGTAGVRHATAEHPVDADSIRLRPQGVGLRNAAGTAHATFAFGNVTPARRGTRLHAVLLGAPPASRFASPGELARACAEAKRRTATWRPVDGPVVVRHVTWEGTDVTLVGY